MKKKITKVKLLFLSFWGVICMVVTVTVWGGALAILGKMKIISRSTVQYSVSLWARTMLRALGMKVIVRGTENIDFSRSHIYMFNHQSMLDIPVTIGYIPQHFVMIAKKELFAMPVFGFILRLIGYIPVDRSDLKKSIRSMKEAGKKIAEEMESVGIYPEGTRTRTGEMNKFKKGGFIIAMEAETPIVPVTINNTFKMVKPGRLILDDVGELELIIHPAVEVTRESKMEDIMEEVMNRIEGGLVQ